MSKFLQAFWSFVTSRNVAIVLLIVVTVMLALGAFLPNPTFLTDMQIIEMKIASPTLYWLGERFNSQKLAGGKIFGFIGIFLVISTSLCSIDRLLTKLKAKAGANFSYPESTAQEPEKTHCKTADTARLEDDIREWFQKENYHLDTRENESETLIVGSRGRAGFWGSIFFHFILITSLLGLVMYYCGSYRATLSFTEGQSYRLDKERLVHLLEEPVWGLNLPNAEVGLIRQYSLYSKDNPLYPEEHVALFRVKNLETGRVRDKEVKINEPLSIEGKTFLLQRGGFSTRIIIRDNSGSVIFDTFVALRNKKGTEDTVSVGGDNTELKLNFYPDLIKEGGTFDTRSLQVKNPFCLMSFYRGDDLLFKELVPLNGEASSQGYRVSFTEVRRWVEMELVGEPGIGFFFMTSFVALFGVLVRIIDPDERIYIILRKLKSGIDIYSYTYSKHFAGLAEDKRMALLSFLEEKDNS